MFKYKENRTKYEEDELNSKWLPDILELQAIAYFIENMIDGRRGNYKGERLQR